MPESINFTKIQQKNDRKEPNRPKIQSNFNQEVLQENMKLQYNSDKFIKIEGKKEEEKLN